MKKILIGLFFVLLVAAINVPNSSGFPWIYKQFRDQYLPSGQSGDEENPLKAKVREAGCYVCHDTDHPKSEEGWQEYHNAYGQALVDILGDPEALEERWKDRENRDEIKDEIDAALEEVAGQPCGDSTFGEILEGGDLPVPLPEGFGDEDDDEEDSE